MLPEDSAPDVDQVIRINELRESAREAAGGEMTSWESDDMPPEVAEGFWKNVLDYEQAPETCHFKQLLERGVDLPAPSDLRDAALTDMLWRVIHELAAIDVYMYHTDHLSDRELYTLLHEDLLWEACPDLPPGTGWRCHLDILGGCSEEDIYLSHKFYADDEQREYWQSQYPEDEMPDHVDPPYDRDRHLPKAEDEHS